MYFSPKHENKIIIFLEIVKLHELSNTKKKYQSTCRC